jgi:hypothetical protein
VDPVEVRPVCCLVETIHAGRSPDIACGRGGLIRQFAPAVADCMGIDGSGAMVAIASEVKPANARFVVGNLLKPPLPEASIHFVVSRQVMEIFASRRLSILPRGLWAERYFTEAGRISIGNTVRIMCGFSAPRRSSPRPQLDSSWRHWSARFSAHR